MISRKNIIATLTAIFILSPSVFALTPKSAVDFDTALNDAKKIASQQTNWEVLKADGNSMNPFFGKNSLLLVEKTDMDHLKTGMIAVYRDSEGDLVAHKVISINADHSAQAKGINNTNIDPDPITASNLYGVVFGMLHSKSSSSTHNLPIALGKSY